MDGCSVDASAIRVPTDVLEGSDDAFNSAHGGGDDAHRSSEECGDNEEIHSENDSEDDDTRPFQDADQDPSSGTEGDSGDDLRGDRTSVDQDPSSGTEGDSGDDLPGDRTSVPSFDESQLLARCIADFGTKTLPGSATTIAVAVVLIMSFIAAHGLPWSAVDDLLKLVEALFGFQKCGLPQSKYLLRKLWSAKCDSVGTYHYCCSQCGKLLDISGDKIHLTCNFCQRRLLYLHSKPDVERTSAGIRRDMTLASRLKTPVNGLKGASPLVKLPHFDLVWGYTVEYMHSVLLGVTRQFADYWFDSSNSNEAYYMGRPSTLRLINKRLLSIRPPHHFTRLPRTLQERCYWKAHEWRNWLLFYCLPCCRPVLPPRYFRHFALLSEAIFVLILQELSSEQIDHAGWLLTSFVSQAAGLYGQRCMRFNVHQLLHLAEAARQFGPLWAHSAFAFESSNGDLVKLVNAAKAVPAQVLERVVMSQELQILLVGLPLPSNVLSFCSTMLWSSKN
ncbi:hypothetical protein MTO96_028757 [Rhipicephalus appendiculatus]